MKVTIIGTGYVGLVTAAFFSDIGHDVIACDIDESKINKLKNGNIPFFERGLSDLVQKNYNKSLNFSSDIKSGIEFGDIVCNCVGTPSLESGEANLEYVFNVAKSFGKYINNEKILINKSTVPIGTAEKCKNIITSELKKRNINIEFSVCSNPEFLREGTAVKDAFSPDRIICGIEKKENERLLRDLYKPITNEGRPTTGRPIIFTDIKSAELIKYASNCFLATKISFINEIANFCEKVDSNIDDVAKCMGLDSRIGSKFLHAGIGYGGSCFPKDVKSLIQQGKQIGYNFQIIDAVHRVNEKQKNIVVDKLLKLHTTVANKKIAIWGLSFKPNTDDVRESPAITIVKELQSRGAIINTYDPLAIDNFKKELNSLENINFLDNKYNCLKDSEALIVITEWDEFRTIDFKLVSRLMNKGVIIDGRNIYSKEELNNHGISYYGIG